jgi:hypothetical protein
LESFVFRLALIFTLLGLNVFVHGAEPTAEPRVLSRPAAADVNDGLAPPLDEDGPLPEGVGLDESGTAAPAYDPPLLDLKALGSPLLARLAGTLKADVETVWYDSESGEIGEENAPGAWRVPAAELYAELARRATHDGDKDARAALNLALLRNDPRARDAQKRAVEDEKALVLIAKIEDGDAASQVQAKAALAALAETGNLRARQYLGLDAANPTAAAPAGPIPDDAAAPESAPPKAKTAALSKNGAAAPSGPPNTPAP